MTRTTTLCSAAILILSIAACGAPEEDDIGVTEEMPTGTEGELAAGPRDGASMELDQDAMGRPDGSLTEALDSDVRGDIVTVAEQDGRFVTLLGAVEAAGLTDALRRGEYTLFAPTDEAFEALGPEAVGQLMLPENREQLATILRYHVVENPVMAADVTGMVDAQTLAGDALMVERVGDRVQVGGEGGAVVIDADVPASNGVIHAIDTVLIPPAD